MYNILHDKCFIMCVLVTDRLEQIMCMSSVVHVYWYWVTVINTIIICVSRIVHVLVTLVTWLQF